MKVYTELYITERHEYIEKTFRERLMYAKPRLSFGDWKEGIKYDVLIQEMRNKRICIYKSTKHFNEESGYMVFNTMSDLLTQFEVQMDTEFVGEKSLGKDYYPPKGVQAMKYA